MKLFHYLSVLLVLMAMQARAQNVSSAFQLDDYRWKNRLVLIFGSETDSLVSEQRSLLEQAQQALTDRDLLVFTIPGPDSASLRNKATELRRQFKVSDDTRITTVLIGKDGSEKLRVKNNILTLELLTSTIDAMPMRRREMRRQHEP